MKEKAFYRSVLKNTLLDKTNAKARIDARTRSGFTAEKTRIHISHRAVIAIAVAASLLVVGSAAAATSLFSREGYVPGRYIQKDADERHASEQAIPDVEQAITAATPKDVSYEIRMMPEIDTDGKIAEWREQMGQPAYNEADWAWVRELKPTIGDVLYDGKALYVTTYIETDRPNVFYYAADTEQQAWIASEEVSYTVPGDAMPHTLELYGENWGNDFTDHSVKVVAEGTTDAFPEEGIVTMTQRLYVADALVDDMLPTRAAVAIIDFTFTFDAAAGRSVAEDAHISIPLSGEYLISMEEWWLPDASGNVSGNAVFKNKPLNVDGVMLDAKIEYRPVGIYVTLTVKDAPENWTQYEKNSLLTAISDWLSEEPDIPFTVNGEEPQKPEHMNYGANDAIYVLLPIYPSDYASVSSLKLDLLMHRIVSVNGQEPSDDWTWDFEKQGGINESIRVSEPLATIEIPIPKN